MKKIIVVLSLTMSVLVCGCEKTDNVEMPQSSSDEKIDQSIENTAEEVRDVVAVTPNPTEAPEEKLEEEVSNSILESDEQEMEGSDAKEHEPTESSSDLPKTVLLKDLDLSDSYYAKISPGAKDVTGEKYNNALVFHYINTDHRGEPYYAYYYLDGKYNVFSGYAGYCVDNLVVKDVQEETEKMQIYGDDKELYSIEIDKHTPPEHFEIDISGISVLKILYGDGQGKDRAMIVNGELSR